MIGSDSAKSRKREWDNKGDPNSASVGNMSAAINEDSGSWLL